MTFKYYSVTLTTFGPVFIGGGKKLRKSEYIYDVNRSQVHIVDGPRLTRYLSKQKKLDSFLQYLEKFGKGADLKRFLNDSNIKQEEWNHFTTGTERVNQGKTVASPPSQNNGRKKVPNPGDRPMNDLDLFVRDGQNEVYIPGSSLKGALRTIILQDIEEDTYENAMFKKIKVSDSRPIANDHMAIYQKIDINKACKPMPLYRECVDAGTEVHFDLAIEDDVISIGVIEKKIKQFYQNYSKWLDGFKMTEGGKQFMSNGGFPKMLNAENHPQVIFLGGGAGFVSKTLQYQMHPKEEAKREVYQVLKRQFWATYGKMKEMPENVPVALKGTVDNSRNRWYQQGACMISFKEKSGGKQ